MDEMRILVIGAGKVGEYLAEHLTKENHDVTVIDKDDEVLTKCQDDLDVMCVKGNGANAAALLEAGVDRADIVIATTASDETNMLSCLISKQLGAKYTIARIRDPEFSESQLLLQQQLGIDVAINPERASAQEISRLLRYPFAGSIESFVRGRVEMVEFRAKDRDPFVGIQLKELSRDFPDVPRVLYAMVERDGEVMIPGGDFVIQPEDRVFITGEPMTIHQFFSRITRNSAEIRNIMILGGSRISYYLSRTVLPMGIHTVIIEIDPKKAEELSEKLPKADIIQGDGTDQDVLAEQGLKNMDAFIALCDRDEENLMTAMYTSQQGVPCVVAKNSRLAYADILNRMGLNAIISPKSITCSIILRYVRARENSEGTAVEKLYRLLDGKAEALEFIARKDDSYINIPLRNLTIRKDALVAIIVHKDRVIIPFGDDDIEDGDHVVVITRDSGICDLNEVLRK